MTEADAAGREERVTRAVDDFRELWIDGARPDPREFCAQYPECGPALRSELERFMTVAHGLEGCADLPDEPLMPDAPAIKMSEPLGDYRLIREIGRGGMGVVFEAEQITLRRIVALKVLPAHVTLRSASVERFQREASTAARLRHEGLVEVHAVGEHEGAHYFSMSFIEGAPLDEVIDELRKIRFGEVDGERLRRIVQGRAHRASERIGEEETTAGGGHAEVWEEEHVRAMTRIVRQVADALEYAHRAGVVHRDVKPSNILLQPDGTAVLTDFGLAREEGLPSLTMTGVFAGTAHYVSPEQAEPGGDVDARSDVYSLGATLYELLTLQRPFEERSSRAVLGRILSSDEVTAPRRHNRRIPRDLETICLTALQKNPGQRYQSAGEMAADLRRFLDDRPLKAQPVGPIERALRLIRRKPLRSSAAAAFLMLGLLFLFSEYRNVRELRREKAEAVEQQYLLERTLEFMTTGFGFGTARPSEPLNPNAARMAPIARGETITARILAMQAIGSIGLVTEEGSVPRALMCRTMGIVCRLLGRYEESGPLLREALELYRTVQSPDERGEIDCLHHLALLQHDLMVQEGQTLDEIRERYATARRLYADTLAVTRSLLGETDDDGMPGLRALECSILHNQGVLKQDWRGHRCAVIRNEIRLGIRPRAPRTDPSAIREYQEINRLGDEAERLLREALAGREQLGEHTGELQAATRHQLALLRYEQSDSPYAPRGSDPERARPILEEAAEEIRLALELTPPTLDHISGRSQPHPDLRSRRLLQGAIESGLDPRREVENEGGLDRLITAGIPPIYCIAVSPGPTSDAERTGEPASVTLIVRFDPRAPGRHRVLADLSSSAEATTVYLSPTLSRGRLGGLVQEGRESSTRRVLIIDTEKEAPPK
jgi:serine/threonine protein kinase